MSDFWVAVTLIVSYVLGFCIVAMVEARLPFLWKDAEHPEYTPWATPIPLAWPIAIPLGLVALAFWLLGRYAGWLAGKGVQR